MACKPFDQLKTLTGVITVVFSAAVMYCTPSTCKQLRLFWTFGPVPVPEIHDRKSASSQLWEKSSNDKCDANRRLNLRISLKAPRFIPSPVKKEPSTTFDPFPPPLTQQSDWIDSNALVSLIAGIFMRCLSTNVWRCPVILQAESTHELPNWKVKVRKKALRKRSLAKRKTGLHQKKAETVVPAELPSDALRWRGEPWKNHRQEMRTMQYDIYRAAKQRDRCSMEPLQQMLLESTAAKSLAVRRVAMTHPQRRLPGSDGIHSLKEQDQRSLRDVLAIDCRSDIIECIEIARAWSELRRTDIVAPLDDVECMCVCTMMDRAKQVLLSWALEPEFEALWSQTNIMSHRPGRSIHDLIHWMRTKLKGAPRHVMIVPLHVQSAEKIAEHLGHRMTQKAGQQMRSWIEAGLLTLGLSPVAIGRHGEEHGSPILPIISNILCHDLMLKTLEDTFHHDLDDVAVWNGTLIAVGTSAEILSRWKDRLIISAESIGLQCDSNVSVRSTVDDWIPFFAFRCRQQFLPASDAHVCLLEPRDGILEQHLNNLAAAFRLSRIFHEDKSGLINRINPIVRSFSHHFCTADAADHLERADDRLKQLLIEWSIREHSVLTPEEAVKKEFGGTAGADLGFEFKTRIVRLLRHGDAMRIFRWPPVEQHRSPYDGDRSYWEGRLQHWEHDLYPSLL